MQVAATEIARIVALSRRQLVNRDDEALESGSFIIEQNLRHVKWVRGHPWVRGRLVRTPTRLPTPPAQTTATPRAYPPTRLSPDSAGCIQPSQQSVVHFV